MLEKVEPGKPCHFPPDSPFRTAPGLLTKGPLRAMVPSLVSPSPSSVVWDVGSGSGAVAISLSPLVDRVYAVENEPKHLEILRANRRVHGAWNVIPVAGEAPGVLLDHCYQWPGTLMWTWFLASPPYQRWLPGWARRL